jgi:hypothetical protein
MVRLSATCASDAVPVRFAKLIPNVEVAMLTHDEPLYERRLPYSGDVSETSESPESVVTSCEVRAIADEIKFAAMVVVPWSVPSFGPKRNPDGEVEAVPPFETASVPVTSDARLMSEVDTAPAVALRKPVRLPSESEPKNACVEDAYVDEKFVVEALVNVPLPPTEMFVEIDASPTTSSLAKVEVELAPIKTWLVVVETRTPDPLK